MQNIHLPVAKFGLRERTVGAFEARRQFGKLLQGVAVSGEKIIVERHGEPIAAVVPIEIYDQWKSSRNAFFAKIRGVANRTNLTDKKASLLAKNATKAVRSSQKT